MLSASAGAADRAGAGAGASAAAGAGSSGRAGSASDSPTGLRTTTGGMGRDPGMLMRIRVVSVVSVFGSESAESPAGVDGLEVTVFPSGGFALPVVPAVGFWLDPYGGVPDG
ncbi:hypothetical protein [Streptomyces sp. NPDC012888]|uniref:hypothetical protein n=1 Tax=Streptomyces sp. NPDC012888 TaxID=3364855 RepID=UPI003682FC22